MTDLFAYIVLYGAGGDVSRLSLVQHGLSPALGVVVHSLLAGCHRVSVGDRFAL